MLNPARIVAIGMVGAGNLGDDLISVCLCDHLLGRWPNADLTVILSGKQQPFHYSRSDIHFFSLPRPTNLLRYANEMRQLKELIGAADLILVGGGGLIQDVHSAFNVPAWLRFASLARPGAQVWGVGLGAGPLLRRFSRFYLRRALPAFDTLQVRDNYSADLLREFGGQPEVSVDIVAGSCVERQGFKRTQVDSALGCCLRAWPGLNPEAFARAIESHVLRNSMSVRLFTFEFAVPGNTGDRDLHSSIAKTLRTNGILVEEYCYGETPIETFCSAFCSVQQAIAMRFHANILWQKLGIPVCPVTYSSKVTALYEEGGKPDAVRTLDSMGVNALSFESLKLAVPYRLPDLVAGRGSRSKGLANLASMTAAGLLFWRIVAGTCRHLLRAGTSRRLLGRS